MTTTTYPNKRSTPRWEADFDVIYNDGRTDRPGVGFEINTSGMAFCAEKLLRAGTEIEVQYRLTRDQKWVKVRAVVTNRAGQKMGVRFLNLGLGDRLELERFFHDREVAAAKGRK
jgi:PilZ domain-containing protein